MKKLIKFLFVISVLFAALSAYQVWTYGVEEKEETDAAIVLGAAQWNGDPSPVFLGRIKEAIDLYQEGYVEYLIFTGGKSEEAAYSEAEVGKQTAMEAGVPEENILVEETSLVTKENLQEAKKLASEYSFATYYLVSDQYHLKRAVAMAQDIGMNAKGVATSYSAYETMETKFPFFFKEWVHYMGYEVSHTFDNIGATL
ncbi:YdcF family protein [Salimicrobium sp. PL1-032A]|uniref:YdcF family protein n=1 Tax=Salimicrobium sp. PL1-032A TaxID=3095364 RepID=UPI0032613A93